MEIEKTGCGCTQCHTEVPTTKPSDPHRVKPEDVAGGIFLCVVMLVVGVLTLLFYLEDDGG